MKTKRESLGAAFHRLWAASLASNIADGLFKTSVPLLATALTKDPVLISMLGALVMLPWLLFAIPIGTLVDRVDRRNALALANSVRLAAGSALSISIVGGWVNIGFLFAVAFVTGIAEVLYDTTAQALIPNVVKTQHLERANSRLEVGGTILGEIVGSPISGMLYVVAIAAPFISGTVGIAVAFILVLLIPGQFKKPVDSIVAPRVSMVADMKFGIRYLYQDKTLLKLVLFTTSMGLWFSATGSTFVLFVLDVLKVPTAWYGVVILAPAAGSILGGSFAARISQRFGRMHVMSLAIFLGGFVLIFVGLAPNVYVWLVLIVLQTALLTTWNVLLMSTYHQIIPNELFGRIHGTRRTLVWGVMPIGSLIGGLLAKIDLRAPVVIGGAICTVIALFGIPFVRRLSSLINEKQPSEQQMQA
jgi:MFS family permease